MKKQATYLVIGFTALIIAGSALYYFVVFLPRQNENSRVFAVNQRCREVGEKIYQEDLQSGKEREERSRLSGKNTLHTVLRPTYGYNEALNTCLYSGGFNSDDAGGSILGRWVKDAFTNADILRFDTIITKDGKDPYVSKCEFCTASLEEFEKREQKLFQ